MTNEISDRDAQALVNQATGTGGPKPAAGILVVCAIVLALACGLCGAPPLKVAQNITEADKARAQADEKQAEALVVEAEAELKVAEAEAKILTDYSEVAKAAINADRRRAHPEEIFSGLLAYSVICCLGVIAIPLLMLALLAATNPKRFREIIHMKTLFKSGKR